jgi:hypothetical protein
MIDRRDYAAQNDEDTSLAWNLHHASYCSTAIWIGAGNWFVQPGIKRGGSAASQYRLTQG